MSPIDFIIFFAYLAGVVALGAAFARRQRAPQEFFLAGRSMHWFPIGLSVMVTAFHAMQYAAFSTEVLGHGLYVVLSVPVFVLVALPITRVFMPYFHGMRLTSAYEVLEHRFDVRVRQLASVLFILWRVLWMAVALYVPCLVLSRITGVDLRVLVVVAGVAATVYTASGGMRAVMWTDVAQWFVLFGGLVVGIAVVCARTEGGFVGMLRAGSAAGLTRPFAPFDPQVLSLDPRVRITVWSALVGTFVAFLARYGADQVVVQRYFTARSLREAQRGFWLNVGSVVVSLGCLALLGFAIHAQAAASPAPARALKPLARFADFVSSLPAGACGLLVAGLFAASMSSVDSGIHSCSTAFATDLWERRGRVSSVAMSRVIVAVLGVLVIAMACFVGRLGTIFGIANRIINGLGSPLLALFLLGMFSRRANAAGMLVGGVLGTAASVAVSFGVSSLALHYYAVANLLATLALCYGCSLVLRPVAGGPTAEQLGWTWWERRRSTDEQGAAT